MTAPTAIPAFAPVERPPPPPDEASGVWEAERPAPVGLAAAEGEELGVGASNSSLVTLKQGT